MADARQAEDWRHTSEIVAMVHNVQAKDQKPANEFNLYEKSKKGPASGKKSGKKLTFKQKLASIKPMFVPEKPNG